MFFKKRKIPDEEIQAKLELHKYIALIIFIWCGSWFPSTTLGVLYYKYILKPDLAQYGKILPIFTNTKYMIVAFTFPGILLGLYFLHLFGVAFLSKLILKVLNSICPAKELISAKGIGKKEARDVNFYHLRGVVFRILKWTFAKCPFPWLLVWAFNYVGSNKLGKGTVLEDQFYTHEFLETGENVYIGPGSIVSSHLVEGKYGAITLKRVIMGDNVVLSAFDAVSPGVYLEPYAELLPMSAVIKFQKVKGFAKYYGLPVYRLGLNRYMKLMQIPKEMKPIIEENRKKKALYHPRKKKEPVKSSSLQKSSEQ